MHLAASRGCAGDCLTRQKPVLSCSLQSHCCFFGRIAVCSVSSVALLFLRSHCCLFSLFSRIAVSSVALLFLQSHCCFFSCLAVSSLLFLQSHCCFFSRTAVSSVALLFLHCCFFSRIAVSSLLFLQSHCCFFAFSRIAVSSVVLLFLQSHCCFFNRIAGRSDQSSRGRFRRADVVLSLKNSASTVLLNNHEPVWPSGKSGVIYILVSGRTRHRFDSASALLSLRKL